MRKPMKLQLQEWKKQNMSPEKKQHKKKTTKKPIQKPKQEKLSERDLKYLMGEGRPTYRKYRGSFRQKG